MKKFTQEMLDDLSKMGDAEFSKKWNVSRQLIIRRRQKLGIRPFNNQHGLREHRIIYGIEYKYCPREGGHYSPITEFGKGNSRYDGLRGICKPHENQRRVAYNVKETVDKWKKTENGRKSLRNTWRKEKAKKDNAYILWEQEHEIRAYNLFERRCAYCGTHVDFLKLEFDHFIPIALGGKTHPNNMLPCCKKCNHGTGGKFKREPMEWLTEKFGHNLASFVYQGCKNKLEKLGEI